ncbi:hypothetical protein RDWZM_004849 [Blomia tropicalis]|uniref:Ceramide transfer protein n=1 Tax=Blomia tropicalis TaxID=40697 RepID=A0A9Q0M4W0_BLOTA|nr:hypothetical protein RDWZM_004849 [Blomia tropicalis]
MSQAQMNQGEPPNHESDDLADDLSKCSMDAVAKSMPLSASSSLSSSSNSLNESVGETLGPSPLPSMSGVLLKWTNYIHGWQQRFIVLKDGTLSYYKSEDELSFGCRGAITIIKSNIKLHDIDECRFDIGVADCVWYLRASSVDECTRWVQAIQTQRNFYQGTCVADSGSSNSSMLNCPAGVHQSPSASSFVPSAASSTASGPTNYNDSLRRHESALSLSSITSCRSYKEQLSEMDTFRNILYQQIKTLQHYFDSSLQSTSLVNEHLKRHRRHQSMNGFNYLDSESNRTPNTNTESATKNAQNSVDSGYSDSMNASTAPSRDNLFVDFKKEAFTFKATTAGIIATLTHCIDLMNQREDQWKKRLEKEKERRRSAEDHTKRVSAELEETRRALAEIQLDLQRNVALQKQIQEQQSSKQVIIIGGPDYEEGPHSMIKEDEFFDAIDAALDRNDQQEEDMRQLKLRTMSLSQPLEVIPPERCDHELWPEIDRITKEQLYYARLEVEDTPASGGGSWELFAEDGEMRLYKRELEIDGLVCDPLKAVHTVRGVSAHEVCHQFFSPDVRFDWENTLESMKVVEDINPNTLIFHQIHKRVWPAAQRDTVFWSHIRRIDSNTLRANGHPNSSSKPLPDNLWVVCNNSVQRNDIPASRCLRMTLVVSLVCETYIDPPVSDISKLTRDHLKCKIIYCSKINPGGWAPASVLRALYKREYPKFLKRYTQYCIDLYKDKPIML